MRLSNARLSQLSKRFSPLNKVNIVYCMSLSIREAVFTIRNRWISVFRACFYDVKKTDNAQVYCVLLRLS